MRTDEELRDSGWAEEDITAYRRGLAEAAERMRAARLPAAPPVAPGPARYLPGEPFRYSGNSDRARWQRETAGGQLSLLAPAVDEAAELAEARALADQHELTYGSRPDLAVFLAKIRHEGPRGLTLTGTVEEIGAQFRSAGLQFSVIKEIAQPRAGGAILSPGRAGPEPFGDPELAGQVLAAAPR